MKPALLLVFIICCKVFADDAQLRSDCETFKNNRWVNGICEKCPKCEQGYGLNMSCGNGHGTEAICVRCVEFETFNSGSDQLCLMCKNCTRYHRKYKFKCRPEINAECGECDEGFYDADQLAGSVIDMKPICTKCRPKSVIHKCIEDAHKLKVADVDDKERLTRLTNHFLNLKVTVVVESLALALTVLILVPLICHFGCKLRKLRKSAGSDEEIAAEMTDMDKKSKQEETKKNIQEFKEPYCKSENSEEAPLMDKCRKNEASTKKELDDMTSPTRPSSLKTQPTERKVQGSIAGAFTVPKVKDERQRSHPASSSSESDVMTSQYTYDAERTRSHKMPSPIEKLYDKALSLCKEMDFGDLDLDIRDSIHDHLCNKDGKNFRHVGEKFGFTLLEIQRFRGMGDLFAPLIHRKKTLGEFLQILKDLERFDVVKDLSYWIIGSRGAGCADDHASSLGAAVDETGDPTKTYLYAPLRA